MVKNDDSTVIKLLSDLIEDEEQIRILKLISENYSGEELLKKLLEIS